MRRERIHNNPALKQFRRQLRNNATAAEAVLWTYLKNRQLKGRKFRRQHSIGKYIVDFHCPQENLVIELDGEDHFWQKGLNKDAVRTNFLNSLGLKTIRIENKWVFNDIAHILSTIQDSFAGR